MVRSTTVIRGGCKVTIIPSFFRCYPLDKKRRCLKSSMRVRRATCGVHTAWIDGVSHRIEDHEQVVIFIGHHCAGGSILITREGEDAVLEQICACNRSAFQSRPDLRPKYSWNHLGIVLDPGFKRKGDLPIVVNRRTTD